MKIREDNSVGHHRSVRGLMAIAAVFGYFFAVAYLFHLDFRELINITQAISVTLGIGLLTLAQYKRGMGLNQILLSARQNALLSSAVTTIFALMGALNGSARGGLAQAFLPLLYGCLWYAVLSRDSQGPKQRLEEMALGVDPAGAYPLLAERGFTPREIDVALRLLRNDSNKEIAEALFIAEATVKKHIQNLFKKCGAVDRIDFVRMYYQWWRER